VSPREKMSALEFACSQDVSEVVRVLLQAGAEVPAHIPGWVAQHGWEQSLHCLTDGFVDPNAIDGEGKTILHHAVMGKKLGTIRLLVKRGANPKIENASGETPFSMAESMKRHDMMSAMIA
jgi:ankyrin repeat protein